MGAVALLFKLEGTGNRNIVTRGSVTKVLKGAFNAGNIIDRPERQGSLNTGIATSGSGACAFVKFRNVSSS